MSSGDEEYSRSTGEDAKLKKRRIQRACDTCRRKKIRCDGATTPGNKCSNCAAYSYDCTYVEAAKKRGPPKGYVESLEGRLQKMESLLQRLCPDADFTQELGVHMDRETWYSERQALPQLPPPPSPAHPHLPDAPDDPQPPDDVHRLDDDRRFHGRSSGLVLVQAAIDMKREYTGADPTAPHPAGAHPSLWGPPDLRLRPADGPADDPVAFDFPPPDLVDALVPLFFVHNNTYLPVLHRPTFDRQYRDRLHERDPAFAHILLLVCAIAARNSHDPRVLRPDVLDRHSAGWKYFDQVRIQRKSLIAPASLFDLQQYALAGIFLQGSAAPYAGWVTVGIGLRVAQDVGAHRKRIDDPAPSVQSELWKRAFWVLVNLDRLGSAALGRPCAIHDEDFDLDPPLEVDDEYWESPSPEDAFVQPTGRPSTVAYFNALIRLDQILSFALRTIYSINKSKILLGFAGEKDWAQNTVVELDTALNQWLETVPEHLRWDLRWDPSNEFSVFFQQSAILYATYYHIQILVHRPFIPRPGKPAPLSFPSLAICTNAARSCSQVLQAHRSKCDPGAAPHLMFYAFTSGLVLLLNIWGTHRPGHAAQRPPDADMPMHDVHMCMQFLKAAENRWPLAGRLWDILCELASAGDFPLPHPSPVAGSKRERDADSPRSAAASDYAMAQDAASASASPGGPPRLARPQPFRAAAAAHVHALPPPHPDYAQMLDPAPLLPNPNFMQQELTGGPGHGHGHAPGPGPRGDPMTGVQWFAHAHTHTHPSAAPPVLQHLFAAEDAQPQQVYAAPPAPAPGPAHAQFGGGFPNGGGGMAAGAEEQGAAWGGDTLNMWSTAPTGFEWEDWNHFTANMLPGTRPDDPHPHP